MIHFLSLTFSSLLLAVAPLPPCPNSPNCVRSPDNIEPLGRVTIEQVAEALTYYKRVKIVEKDERYLHAVFTSSFFRFKDDFEVLIDDDGVAQVRSGARSGYYDFGVNRKRVECVRKILKGNK